MTLVRLKTGILTVLVVASMVLSYMLWHGNWQSTTEVGLSALPTLPTSTHPQSGTVTRPYQIVVTQAKPLRNFVLQPSSTAYTAWIKRIGVLHLLGLHQVPTWVKPTGADAIECDFGALLSTRELLPWIPALENSTFAVKASSIVLYASAPRGPVYIAISSQNGSFVAETDIRNVQFAQWVQESQGQSVWQPWDVQVGNYVPSTGMMMDQVEYEVESASLIPLVDSFFLNPQALTRIQESKQSVIWTDGSRAVRWDQRQGTLTFEDPNVATQSAPSESSLATALAYIRSHGGSPGDSILFSETSFFNGDHTESYTLQTYVNGYPVFDTGGTYTIDLENGHVIRYRRPLLQLIRQVSSRPVRVLTGAELTSVLHRLVPATPAKNFGVNLGYLMVPQTSGTVRLVPVYNISQSGIPLWSIDATTGKVIKGAGTP